MEDTASVRASLGGVTKRFLHRLLAVGENRFHLFLVEVQEERNRLLDMVFMAVATATLALLGTIAWSVAIVILLWPYGPVATLLVLGALYVIGALAFCIKLVSIRRQQQTWAATLDQFRKDCACLKGN